jgi:hypothetical protein
MNIPNVSLTGQEKKKDESWYPEVFCSLCKKTRYVKKQDLIKMKNCPVN